MLNNIIICILNDLNETNNRWIQKTNVKAKNYLISIRVFNHLKLILVINILVKLTVCIVITNNFEISGNIIIKLDINVRITVILYTFKKNLK